MMKEMLELAQRASSLEDEDRAKFVHQAGPALTSQTKILFRDLAES
jgi:hypothetical protein